MTEIKHEYGNWNVYVDGNLKFSFVYKQDAEAVAEMIDALVEDHRVVDYYTSNKDYAQLKQIEQALIKAGCIDE